MLTFCGRKILLIPRKLYLLLISWHLIVVLVQEVFDIPVVFIIPRMVQWGKKEKCVPVHNFPWYLHLVLPFTKVKAWLGIVWFQISNSEILLETRYIWLYLLWEKLLMSYLKLNFLMIDFRFQKQKEPWIEIKIFYIGQNIKVLPKIFNVGPNLRSLHL